MNGTGETGSRRYRRASCALFVLLVLQAISASRAAAQRYSITDLGTLGGTFSVGTGVNLRGQVSGKSTLPGDTDTHPFLWQNGMMRDLGTFGGPNGEASYLNVSGHMVGGAETGTPDPLGEDFCGFGTHLICQGFISMRSVMTEVGTLGGNNSFAIGINSRNQVVGQAELSAIDPVTSAIAGLLQAHAFLVDHGQLSDLGTLGGANSVAVNINASGQAIGFAEATFNGDPQLGFVPFRPALWAGNGVADLGTLGGKLGQAVIINSEGQVAGWSNLAGDVEFHAFLWQNGVLQDLGTLSGDPDSQALGLNDHGQTVGVSGNPATGATSAFLWQNGMMTDLNTLIPANSGWQLAFAVDINRLGQITGAGVAPNGEFHGFLLTPCDDDHADTEGCQNDREATSVARAQTTERPKVVLPEDVRKLLQQRYGFGIFGTVPRRSQ